MNIIKFNYIRSQYPNQTHISLTRSSRYCLLSCRCLGSITSSRYSFCTYFFISTNSTIQYTYVNSYELISLELRYPFCFKCCFTL